MSADELSELGQDIPAYLDLFLGKTGGCLGETSALALLIGGIYLIARKIINPAAPVTFIGTLALLSLISGNDSIYEILAGGVFLGAFFMATDYATTPITTKGKIVFGIGCGIITFIIRHFASLPEGVSFAILLMNILTPYIERYTRPDVFGAREVKNEK
jgi:electron transport complex protein RnfD